jgi:hypothetical protein
MRGAVRGTGTETAVVSFVIGLLSCPAATDAMLAISEIVKPNLNHFFIITLLIQTITNRILRFIG